MWALLLYTYEYLTCHQQIFTCKDNIVFLNLTLKIYVSINIEEHSASNSECIIHKIRIDGGTFSTL